MRRSARIILILIPLLLFLSSAYGGEFRVTRVYDGDTVKAETPEIVLYIGLVGIDAPEVCVGKGRQGQPFGEAAKKYLESLVLNKTVVVEGYGTLPYPDKNLISVIYLDGMNVNLEMVKHGMAEVQKEDLPKGFDIHPYLEAEQEARRVKNGMWVLKEKYQSPKEWRKKQGGK